MKQIVFLFIPLLSACGQPSTDVRTVETKNIVFDPDFKDNYFSPKIVDDLVTSLKNKDYTQLYSKCHESIKNKVALEDFVKYLNLITRFYGNLKSVRAFNNSKTGNIATINLKSEFDSLTTDLKLIFVISNQDTAELASIVITPNKPYSIQGINTLCKPIIQLVKQRNIDGIYESTSEGFKAKFKKEFFKSTLEKHFANFKKMDDFELIDHIIGVFKKGQVGLSVEYKFKYEADVFKKMLLIFELEGNDLKLINVDFSTNNYDG